MRPESKKALFLDLDGTLLTDDKRIPDRNREAIDEMLGQGHSVIITTGRPLLSAVYQAEMLGLTSEGCYLIAFNGGILYDTAKRKVIYRSTLPLDAVVRCFREAERRGIHVQTYSEDKVLVEPRCDNDIIRLYCSRILMEHGVIPDISELREEPVKMLIIDLNDPAPLEEFRRWISSWAEGEIDTFFSSNEYCEIVRKGLNKGNALRQMAGLIGVDIADTIAAGDAANDLPMIKAAGIGCAMSNATADVKEAADYVTERDNNNSGVAEIIDRFILNS